MPGLPACALRFTLNLEMGKSPCVLTANPASKAFRGVIEHPSPLHTIIQLWALSFLTISRVASISASLL